MYAEDAEDRSEQEKQRADAAEQRVEELETASGGTRKGSPQPGSENVPPLGGPDPTATTTALPSAGTTMPPRPVTAPTATLTKARVSQEARTLKSTLTPGIMEE